MFKNKKVSKSSICLSIFFTYLFIFYLFINFLVWLLGKTVDTSVDPPGYFLVQRRVHWEWAVLHWYSPIWLVHLWKWQFCGFGVIHSGLMYCVSLETHNRIPQRGDFLLAVSCLFTLRAINMHFMARYGMDRHKKPNTCIRLIKISHLPKVYFWFWPAVLSC